MGQAPQSSGCAAQKYTSVQSDRMESAVRRKEKARCKPDFVWREAVPQGYVCVTPAARQQAREDNAMVARHRLDHVGLVR
jgi:hypothetical protein